MRWWPGELGLGPRMGAVAKAAIVLMATGGAVLAGREITPSTVPLSAAYNDQVQSPVRVSTAEAGAIPTVWHGKPISMWRRAYIEEHHHQPPERTQRHGIVRLSRAGDTDRPMWHFRLPPR
jgi:hypothetical protein